MRVLFIGDIVGQPGRRILKQELAKLKGELAVDVCVANAENAAAGFGLTQVIARDLFSFGADILTMGNHTFARSDIFRFIDSEKRLVRPANGSKAWPGFETAVFDGGNKGRLLVFNLLGRIGMDPAESPYEAADRILKNASERFSTRMSLLDFHAEATSEKQGMSYYVDGRVSLVMGTHTHVQTADEKILTRGTGHISDAGMTGAADGILGMRTDISLRRLVDRLPAVYETAPGRAMINGVLAELNPTNGKCISIERIQIFESQV